MKCDLCGKKIRKPKKRCGECWASIMEKNKRKKLVLSREVVATTPRPGP